MRIAPLVLIPLLTAITPYAIADNDSKSDDRARESRSRDKDLDRDDDRDDSSYSRQRDDERESRDDREHSDRASRPDREERSSSREDRDNRSEERSRERNKLGATFSTDDDDQLVISKFDRDSSLSSAGLRRGDAIISVNGRRVANQRDLERWIYNERRPSIVVLRDGRERTIYVEDLNAQRATDQGRATLGVTIDPQYRNEVVIKDLSPNGAAEKAGLEPGDTILSIDREEVQDLRDLRDVLRQYSPGEKVEVAYLRNNREDSAIARLDEGGKQRASRYKDRATYSYDQGTHRTYYRDGGVYTDDNPNLNRRSATRTNVDDYPYDGRDSDRRGIIGRRTRLGR